MPNGWSIPAAEPYMQAAEERSRLVAVDRQHCLDAIYILHDVLMRIYYVEGKSFRQFRKTVIQHLKLIRGAIPRGGGADSCENCSAPG